MKHEEYDYPVPWLCNKAKALCAEAQQRQHPRDVMTWGEDLAHISLEY